MAVLRILAVDDELKWRDFLLKLLPAVGDVAGSAPALVEAVESFEEAHARLSAVEFDLVVADFALRSLGRLAADSDELGLDLVAKMRLGSNRHCAVVFFTARATTKRFHRALQELGASRLVKKQELRNPKDGRRALLEGARQAILQARLRGAEAREDERSCLTISYRREGWTEAVLRGPRQTARVVIPHPAGLDSENLGRRAENLNLLLRQSSVSEDWRNEIKDLGRTLYKSLTATAAAQVLGSALAQVDRTADLELRLCGPASGLAAPFETLWDETEYLCLRHLLSRELVEEAPRLKRNKGSFAQLVEQLTAERRPLRILLIGSNSDGEIPGVEKEVEILDREITGDLGQLGLNVSVTPLLTAEATHPRVTDEIRSGGFHILHFAGHGWFDTTTPERSGLALYGEDDSSVLSAAELNLHAGSGTLHLVFLSCCRSGASTACLHRGDFYGLFDALARADVPIVLGYRWVVSDDTALRFAHSFYSALWRTFSPAESVLAARRACASAPDGRTDWAWISAVLLQAT